MPPVGKPFQKGHDPRRNAGGRPRVPDYVRQAFDDMLPEALESLRKDLTNDDPQVRHVARTTVFLYRVGKEQLPDVDDEAGGRVVDGNLTNHMTPEELESVERALLAAKQRADAGTGAGSKALPVSTAGGE